MSPLSRFHPEAAAFAGANRPHREQVTELQHFVQQNNGRASLVGGISSSVHANELAPSVSICRASAKKEFQIKLNFVVVAASICALTFACLLFQAQLIACKSAQDQSSNTLEDNLKLTTLTPPTTTTQTIETKSTISQLLIKLKNTFAAQKSKSVSTTQLSPTVSTEPTVSSEESNLKTNEEEEEVENENEPSAVNDDNDSQDCKGLSADESAETKNLTDAQRLVNLQSCLQGKVSRRLKSATRSGMEMFEKLSLTGGCSASLMNLMSSVMQTKAFAFKFLDASAKMPSGLMHGLLSDFGDFDQCLAIRATANVAPENEAEEGTYSGKYCLVSAKLNYKIKVENNSHVPEGIQEDGVLWDELIRAYWTRNATKGVQAGICLPSRCTDSDIKQLYEQVSKDYNVVGEVIACQDSLDLKRQFEPDWIQLFIIYSYSGLLIITLLGTLIDRYSFETFIGNSQRSHFNWLIYCVDFEILACFSLSKNWKKFMRKDFSSSDSLDSPVSRDSSTITSIHSSASKETSSSNEDDCSIKNKLCQELTVKIQPDQYAESNQRMYCLAQLSGLKLFVILWITSGQSFLYPSANNYQYYRSIINMNITRNSVWFAATNFTLGIDMLLYMTGLLFVYKLANFAYNKMPSKENQFRNEGRFHIMNGIFRIITKKILRFWPTYLTLIALTIVVPLLAAGPMWPEMVSKRLGQSCRKNWWSNLIFMNNYFLTELEVCLPSSWFVSILMQLFFVGSIIMLIVRKFSLKIAYIVISILLLATTVISFSLAYFMNVNAPVIRMDESFVMEMDDNIFRLYTSIFSNLGPFLIGMLGGFFLLNSQRFPTNRSPPANQNRQQANVLDNGKEASNKHKYYLLQILIAILVISVAVLVLSSIFHENYTRLCASIYWSLHRSAWAFVTGYLIHQCATGRWKLLNDLLSLSTFIPLSRLIFIAYLIHPILIHMHSGLVRDGLHVSFYNMMNIYITRLFMTFSLALIIHLLVELPFCSIEEIYLNRWMKRVNDSSKESKKFHPLLIVAPVVSINSSFNQFKTSEQQTKLSSNSQLTGKDIDKQEDTSQISSDEGIVKYES